MICSPLITGHQGKPYLGIRGQQMSEFPWYYCRQVVAIKSINTIAFATISLAPSNLDVDGANEATISTTLLATWLANDRANRLRRLLAFDRAIDHHHCKQIAITVIGLLTAMAIPWSAARDYLMSESPRSSLLVLSALVSLLIANSKQTFMFCDSFPIILILRTV